MPPTGTWPKLMEAGATEIEVAPPALCWLNEVLEPPDIPVQPEIDRITKSIKVRVETGIAFIPMTRARFGHFSARAHTLFLSKLFIANDCGLQNGKRLLALRTFKVQGSAPAPRTRL